MKQKLKQAGKEIGLIVLLALGLCLILTLAALVRSLLGGSLSGSLWRLCAFSGGIVLLLSAVFLLSGRLVRQKMKAWTEKFPHVPFAWALVLVGAVLILFACMVNRFMM